MVPSGILSVAEREFYAGAMTTAVEAAALAATGSDVAPWLIGAGIVIVLGAIALIVGQVVRSRRAAAAQADAAAALAEAASPGAAAPGQTPPSEGSGASGTDPISPDEPR